MTPNTESTASERSPQLPPESEQNQQPEAPEPFAAPKPPGPHPLTQQRIWLPLAITVFVLNIPFLHLWLRGPAKITTTIPFSDNYDRTDLGGNYFSTGGFWRIIDGWLYSPGVKNNPLWLQASLPHDVVVEFDAKADSNSGDVKAEIFGNGRDHGSGYVLVFGGWNNSKSVLARLDEHGKDVREDHRMRAERGRTYHFKIVREGTLLTWYIDGEKFLDYDDKEPLYGPDNDRFGFITWQSDAYFDKLVVRPLHG